MKQTINIPLAVLAVVLIVAGYVMIAFEVRAAPFLAFAGFMLMIPAIMYKK